MKWANGRTTGPKILTCHSDDKSGRCCDFVVHRRYKNSFPSTPRFTIILTRSVTSSLVKLTRSDARLRWPSGSRLPPEVGHFRPSSAKRRRVAIRLTAPPAKGRSAGRLRASGKERSKSASRSAQRLRTLKERSRKECDRKSSRSLAVGRRGRPCASDRHRQAETAKTARWSEPAQTGLRNSARCGFARRRHFSISIE